MVTTIKGSILDYSDDNYHIVICHQTNCRTHTSAGLAKSLFNKYPEVNTYIMKDFKRIPGTYNVLETYDGKTVFNLNAQNYPGKPDAFETSEMRLNWIILQKILKINIIVITKEICFYFLN
jgi:hypothetical protein